MDSQTVRAALGQLQHDSDRAEAWRLLKDALGQQGVDAKSADIPKLLMAARLQHAQRHEWDAVAELLSIEISMGVNPERLIQLWHDLAIVQERHLFDEVEAQRAYKRLLELNPSYEQARRAVADSDEKREHWEELAAGYLQEAERAPDETYKSSMLMRVAEMELRFGGEDVDAELVEARLTHAVALDPNNQAAVEMLEHLCRKNADWLTLANLFEGLLGKATNADALLIYALKLARLYRSRLDDLDQAAEAYKRVFSANSAHAESASFLSEYFAKQEAWADLVKLYEARLSGEDERDPKRLGDILQIGMLYYRKLEQFSAAEPWFERVRRLEPANQAALDFFRDYLLKTGDETRLLNVLQSAQRVMPDGPDKLAISQQIAELAERNQGAQKAIEHYKGLLRQDPSSTQARDALKELYRKTGGYSALAELLRQQFERTPAAETAGRLAVLHEVAQVYRQLLPNETALAGVLSQIVAIDGNDAAALRELIDLYEKLGRFRELLSYQQRLAEVSDNVEERVNLLRVSAHRWLEQFSNVQNATLAFESLLALRPMDLDARTQLRELYKKRRAWQALFDLCKGEVDSLSAAEQVAVLQEMAQLSAERLGRTDEALRLYQRILDLDPHNQEVIEALERQAERTRDWVTLADALERHVAIATGADARLGLLQRLGGVYSEQLGDAAGAVRTWRRVLEQQPGHHRALRVLRDAYLTSADYDGLEALYASQNDYDGLAEVLGNAAEKAEDPAQKIGLSYRAARVYEEALQAPQRAFRAYERILSVDPHNARAASALIPLYEHEEKWGRLPPLFEVLIQSAESDAEKLEHLKRVTSVLSTHLGDRLGAIAQARRAYELAPENAEALTLFESMSAAAGNWQSFVESLEARVARLHDEPKAPEPEVTVAASAKKKKRGKDRKKREPDSAAELNPGELDKSGAENEAPREQAEGQPSARELKLKLAQVYHAKLARPERAIELYKALLQAEPTDKETSQELEAVLRREGQRDELRWLLNLRAEHAEQVEDTRQILLEWARLEEEIFGDSAMALSLYQRMLALDPSDAEALDAIARLALSAGDYATAVQALEERRQLVHGAELVEAEALLGQLYLEYLAKPEAALESALAILAQVEHEPRAMTLLERLLAEPATKERAAQVLAEQYSEMGDARHEAEALVAMLSSGAERNDRLELFLRLAGVQEQKLDSHNAAFDTVLRAVREFPDHLELWDRAENLASKAGRPTELAEVFREAVLTLSGSGIEIELCERAARLHQDKLGDPAGAIPYLERVLKRDPSNEIAFAQLKHVLTGQERWGELAELYDLVAGSVADPHTRVELFAEVALVCEEITDDVGLAVSYYEKILALEPEHEPALSALTRLYTKLGRSEDLVKLLEQRVKLSVGAERLELKNQLAALLIDKLLRPADAIGHVEDVLIEHTNDYDARALAEKTLGIGSLRERSAKILELVYESRDEVRELVRVLEVQLEVLNESLANSSDAESDAEFMARYKELLRRIAMLKDQRLHDDDGAFSMLEMYVPLEPEDDEIRQRLLEVGERLAAFARVAQAFERAAGRVKDPSLTAEICLAAARLYDERLFNASEAERLYLQVLELDKDATGRGLEAAKALENVYVRTGQNEKLAHALTLQIGFEHNLDTKTLLQGRLALIHESILGNIDAAIRVWLERLELNPLDHDALASLDRLYQNAERWQSLTEVLVRRHDQSDDPALRREFLVRSAGVFAEKLNDPEQAIAAWRSVLDEFGVGQQAISELARLYQATSRWEDLAESYQSHIEIAGSVAERLELWLRLGDLRLEKLGSPAQALEAYSEALTLDSKHSATRYALSKLLDNEDVQVRRDVALLLRPLYAQENATEELIRVLEIEANASDDPLEKLETLRALAEVSARDLNQPKRALGYVRRAVRDGSGHVDLRPWLDELDRLSRLTGEYVEQVGLLRETLDGIFDGAVKYGVALVIAKVARDELKDTQLARTYFEKALELDSEQSEPLLALDALYEAERNWPELLRILEREAEQSSDAMERKALLVRRARVYADELTDRANAIQVYEQILDIEFDAATVSALVELYTKESRFHDLVSLYERVIDVEPSKLAECRVKIAQIAAERFNDKARAFDELEAALAADRNHAAAIEQLEHYLVHDSDPEFQARAGELLEPIFMSRSNYDKLIKAISARLAAMVEPAPRRELIQRLAKLYEETKEDYLAALDTTARLLHEDIANLSTIAELERLAKVADAGLRLAEIYAQEVEGNRVEDQDQARLAARAAELFSQYGNADRALKLYQSALEFEPESNDLFTRVDQLLQKSHSHPERVALYRRALDYRYDPAERARMLHTIGELERKELKDIDRAIETYVQILDIDDGDNQALDALSDLYRESKRHPELAELLLRRAEATPDVGQSAVYRLELARLARVELGDIARAVDQLEEITRQLPSHPDAIQELEALRLVPEHRERAIEILRPLYEQADSWQRLIALNEDRLARVDESAERINILRETAQLWEHKGASAGNARKALAEALRLDPNDAEIRAEYERLAAQTRAFDELATAYETLLAERTDLNERHAFVATLARIYDHELNDPRKALKAYNTLVELDASDVDAVEKVEQLAMLLSDWPVLVHALTAKIDLLLEDSERASVCRQVGEIKRDMLDDAEGAILAYEQALGLEPEDLFTIDSLISSYEVGNEPQRLIELYDLRVNLTDVAEHDQRYALLMAAAELLEKIGPDRLQAIERLNLALAEKPGDVQALDSLARLYAEEEMWSDYLAILERKLTLLSDKEQIVALRKKLAKTLERLNNFEDAIVQYEAALAVDARDEEAILALIKIATEHEDTSTRVAEILVPVLEAAQRYAQWVSVLELRLAAESESASRVETLKAIARIKEQFLGSASDAMDTLLRALSEAPDLPEIHVEAERLAALCSGWDRYASALEERAAATFDTELARDLFSRLGQVCEARLNDKDRAIGAYSRAVEQAGDQVDLLLALDRLYVATGNSERLSDVLERRLAFADSDDDAAELYFRLACVHHDEFKEPGRALSSLRNALERQPRHEAAIARLELLSQAPDLFEEGSEILEQVYRAAGQTDRLAALYERRVSMAETPELRIEMRRNLARVLQDEAGDLRAAQRVLQQGLEDDPNDASLLDEIEELAKKTGDFAGAAAALERAIEKADALLPDAARELSVKVAEWFRDRAQDPVNAERVYEKALDYGTASDDVLIEIEKLQRARGAHAKLAETLRRRAKLQLDPSDRENLYRQVVQLAEAQEDAVAVEAALRELLEQDDVNVWALESLEAARERANDYKEALSILLRRIEIAADPSQVTLLRHKAARIASEVLRDLAAAVALYEILFDEDPGDQLASQKLRELYATTADYKKLVALLERLVDVAESEEERSRLRLELADLYQTKFDSMPRAIEILQSILEENPAHVAAVERLLKVYETQGEHGALAELLGRQIEIADEQGEQARSLELSMWLAGLYEHDLAERDKAIGVLEAIIERAPSHRPALEALIRLLRLEKRHAEVAERLEQLLLLSSGAEAVACSRELADVYAELGNYDREVDALERGLEQSGGHAEFRERLRVAYDKLENFDKLAQLIADEANLASSNEDKVRLLRSAAKVHAERRSDAAAAAELLSQAARLSPEDRPLLLELCDAYSASGRAEEAVSVLEQIAQSFGGRRSKELVDIHRRLAKAYQSSGKTEQALLELDKAFRIEPGNMAVLKELGLLSLAIGDLKKGQQMFRALLLQKFEADSPISKAEVFYHLAVVHERMDEKPKALQMAERAVQTDASLLEAKALVERLKA